MQPCQPQNIKLTLRKELVCIFCDLEAICRVPILKAKIQMLGKKDCLSFDISIDSNSGANAVDLVKGYMKEFSELRPLALVVKQALKVSEECLSAESEYCSRMLKEGKYS